MSARSTTLITGGGGFIGTNLADRIASEGGRVIVLDNAARAGAEENLRWLCARHGSSIDVELADVRERPVLARCVAAADRVFHFAAQVAVTTGLEEPMEDAEVNVLGTLYLLEEIRRRSTPPRLLFTSTNKVYGDLADVELQERGARYEPREHAIRHSGVDERRPLDFCTPYGCSKGAADQYVLDYAHSYGVASVVFRMSCIYGPHQHGNEDQGWVAHFLIRALQREPITVFGDGKQVRDVLFVEDLVDAFLRAEHDAPRLAGLAFNIGGGPPNCLSLRELVGLIADLDGERPSVEFGPWRTGDQRYYVSDPSAFAAATGWRPRTSPQQGVRRLWQWLAQERLGSSEATAVA
jgi:CDP-paratose 2-epimerase